MIYYRCLFNWKGSYSSRFNPNLGGEGVILAPPPLAPVDFPLITIQYILLETIVQNLVFLAHPSLHVLGNTEAGFLTHSL